MTFYTGGDCNGSHVEKLPDPPGPELYMTSELILARIWKRVQIKQKFEQIVKQLQEPKS